MEPVRIVAERIVRAMGGRPGLRIAQSAVYLAPVLGLLIFPFIAFKPAVTLYVLIVGLAIALLKLVELSIEIEEIARRKLHEYDTP